MPSQYFVRRAKVDSGDSSDPITLVEFNKACRICSYLETDPETDPNILEHEYIGRDMHGEELAKAIFHEDDSGNAIMVDGETEAVLRICHSLSKLVHGKIYSKEGHEVRRQPTQKIPLPRPVQAKVAVTNAPAEHTGLKIREPEPELPWWKFWR